LIVVAGEALIDVIESADGSRRMVPGGGPFNTARALARLGVPAAFLGHLSSDEPGRRLAAMLAADGVSLEMATVGPDPTTTATARLDPSGEARYRFRLPGTSAPNLTRPMLPGELGPEVEALHVGTLGMVLEPMATTLFGLIEREHTRRVVMLDPNIRPGLIPDREYRRRLHHVIAMSTIVKASEDDLAWLYPGVGRQLALDRMIGEGVAVVVVTLGARGAVGAAGGWRVEVPAWPVEVVDTIGAGDAFGAALLAWLHDRGALERDLHVDEAALRGALEFACMAAAITCTRAGADPPWQLELSARAGHKPR
jgi:fructokinase